PLVAAAGISVPMICGKGLGHTGGTVDKLESIPGFKTNLPIRQFIEQVGNIGIAIIGQTNQINPADKKIYALRNATATVESIPLIASSIMSKKIVEGVEGLILDVKIGRGSFIKKKTRAKKLAAFMVEIGKVFGIKTIALITNMDQPLGEMIGNALEVKQAIDILKGKGPRDIKELVFHLGSLMLMTGKKVKNIKEGEKVLKELIEKGKALEKFKEMVIAQGGDGQIINNPDKILPRAKKRIKIQTLESGYLQSMDAREIGIATMLLGAGREKLNDQIDYAVGIQLHKKVGDRVEKGEPVATFYVNNEKKLPLAQEMFLSACKIGRKRARKISLIYEEIR
ncbi:thymidine phosphorylase, partial [bacterium]|nr:thymidine phosphorylase [bacterium]